MLINVTNRPHETWGPDQLEAAGAYGEIVDFPMPGLAPEAPDEEADRIAELVVRRVLRRLRGELTGGETQGNAAKDLQEDAVKDAAGDVVKDLQEDATPFHSQGERNAVVCQGEFVLVFRIVTLLKAEGIMVLAPAFKRVTKPTLRPDGTTVPGYSFDFVRFRSY